MDKSSLALSITKAPAKINEATFISEISKSTDKLYTPSYYLLFEIRLNKLEQIFSDREAVDGKSQ